MSRATLCISKCGITTAAIRIQNCTAFWPRLTRPMGTPTISPLVISIPTILSMLKTVGNEQPQAFGVEKKEEFIPFDGAAQRTRPLIGDLEGTRLAQSVEKPVVGVERATVPIVLGVTMKLIAAGFGDVIDVGTGGAAKLTGVADAHHGRFLDLVLAQEHE